MTLETMQAVTVLCTWQDDWLFWVVLSDGRVYAYNTELWWEHAEETDRAAEWRAVRSAAITRTYELINVSADPYAMIPVWALGDVSDDERHARAFCDLVCETMIDYDFGRLVRR